MSFTAIVDNFNSELDSNRETIANMSRTNPRRVFSEINRMAYSASSKFGVVLQLHFPDSRKIIDVSSYATENLSIVVDPERKRFPIPRESIKEKAREMLGKVETKDAFMYEGKEGIKIFLNNGRIDILPASLHVWCQIDDKVRRFADWLLLYSYGVKPH